MDQERQIRFLYPPIVVLSFFSWAYLDDYCARMAAFELASKVSQFGPIITALAGGTFVLVAGFLLGTLTYLTLRLSFFLARQQSHEFPSEQTILDNIHATIASSALSLTKTELQMATVCLDFSSRNKGPHEWITRRWNAFNVSANITLGVLLSMLLFRLGWCGRSAPQYWYSVGLGLSFIFCANAIVAHRETMGMLAFLAKHRPATSGG